MGEPCPVGRSSHAAVCLGYGGDYPQLLVTGGIGSGGKVLKDAWILDMQSGKWRRVRIVVLVSVQLEGLLSGRGHTDLQNK